MKTKRPTALFMQAHITTREAETDPRRAAVVLAANAMVEEIAKQFPINGTMVALIVSDGKDVDLVTDVVDSEQLARILTNAAKMSRQYKFSEQALAEMQSDTAIPGLPSIN